MSTVTYAGSAGRPLSQSDPRWLRTLAVGVLIVLTLGVVGLPVVIAGTFISEAMAYSPATLTVWLASAVIYLAQVVGYWMITAKDPGATRAAGGVWRLIARYGLIVASLLASASAVLNAFNQDDAFTQPIAVIDMITLFPMSVGVLGSCAYLAGLFHRDGSGTLASQCWLVGALNVLGSLVLLPAMILMVRYPELDGDPSDGQMLEALAVALSALLGGVMLLTALVWWYVLLAIGGVRWHRLAKQALSPHRV